MVPAAVRNYGWIYGPIREGSGDVDHVSTPLRPKLHYHRSGMVMATLAGTDLEWRSARFPALPESERSQILSIVSVRPWELKSAVNGPRKGDILSVCKAWPSAAAFSLSILSWPTQSPTDAVHIIDDLAPRGLLLGDDSRFVVDLSGHASNALLVGHSRMNYDPDDVLEPGTTVAAIPWQRSSIPPLAAFGLWSSTMRNPVILVEPENAVLDHRTLAYPRDGYRLFKGERRVNRPPAASE